MKRAIFRRFIFILSLALVLSGIIFGTTASNIILDKTEANMLYSLKIIDNTLDYNQDLKAQLEQYKEIAVNENTRFTVLDLNGKVLADSDVSDISKMENHMNREEIQEAILHGIGYSKRISNTLKLSMLYVSMTTENKNYILRIAVPFSGLIEYAGLLLPAILLSIEITLAISILIAKRFSKSITKPLHEIAEEMNKLKDMKPEFHFKQYQYEEMNVIADTTLKMAESVRESMKQIEFEKMIRQEFFSNASHELKTPLTSVRGYIELLENGLYTDEKMKKDFLVRIKKETDNMTNLINDILMISRLETKEAEVVISNIRISLLLEEVILSLEPMANQCDVEMISSCRPLILQANIQQIRELLNNLITNAIKYNKPGGKVYITVTSEADDILFIVEDTGVGIPEESRQRVFERFYRVDKGRSKKMGGTGLGLSIVKHIVNYYNGSIELESKVMEGTKFTVRLPS